MTNVNFVLSGETLSPFLTDLIGLPLEPLEPAMMMEVGMELIILNKRKLMSAAIQQKLTSKWHIEDSYWLSKQIACYINRHICNIPVHSSQIISTFSPSSFVTRDWDAMADFLALPKGACTELVTSTFDTPHLETTWTWDALDPMEMNDLELEPEICHLIWNLHKFTLVLYSWHSDMLAFLIGLIWLMRCWAVMTCCCFRFGFVHGMNDGGSQGYDGEWCRGMCGMASGGGYYPCVKFLRSISRWLMSCIFPFLERKKNNTCLNIWSIQFFLKFHVMFFFCGFVTGIAAWLHSKVCNIWIFMDAP